MSSAKSWMAHALVAATLGAGAVVSVAPVEAASSMTVAYAFDAVGGIGGRRLGQRRHRDRLGHPARDRDGTARASCSTARRAVW